MYSGCACCLACCVFEAVFAGFCFMRSFWGLQDANIRSFVIFIVKHRICIIFAASKIMHFTEILTK